LLIVDFTPLEDPAELFTMIFGGEAFVDLIGELSLMKDLTASMEISTMLEEEEERELLAEEAKAKLHIREEESSAAKPAAQPAAPLTTEEREAAEQREIDAEKLKAAHLNVPAPQGTSQPSSGTSTPRRQWGQQALMDKSDEEARIDASLSQEERERRRKDKKKGLTKEQRERLAAFEEERRKQRMERVGTLHRKLVDRLSVWTETDKGDDVTRAFQEKIRLEVENLKMESFGIEILHAIGATYTQKATSFLKSQKFLGISGFFSRLKDKGTLVKETWTTFSTAIDAQMTLQEMVKMEEQGGEDWTDEAKAEYEKLVTGKVLAAAWRGSKFEIQSVLREVCDQLLYDKSIKLEKRIERAQGLLLAGQIYSRVSPSIKNNIMS
jgi:hypothetical protein